VRGTWREDFIPGEPGRYVENDLEAGNSFNRGPAGEPEGGSYTGDVER
jgi:hypothetical protein